MDASFSGRCDVPIFVGGEVTPAVSAVLWNDATLYQAMRTAILDRNGSHASRLLELFREFAPFYNDTPIEKRLEELLAFIAGTAIAAIKFQVACGGFGSRQASPDDVVRLVFKRIKVCNRSGCHALFWARPRQTTCQGCRGRKPNPAEYMRSYRRKVAVQVFTTAVRRAGRGQFKSFDLVQQFQYDPQFQNMIDQWAEESPEIHAARRLLKRNLPKPAKAASRK
jgi:hypothetical protein